MSTGMGTTSSMSEIFSSGHSTCRCRTASLQELLSEAGFEHVLVHWEGTDEKTNEGNGVFTATDMGEADASWICYISAER